MEYNLWEEVYFMVKKTASSLMGLLYILTPWFLGYQDNKKLVLICFIWGIALFLCSLLSLVISTPKAALNWIAIFIGVSFMIYAGTLNLNSHGVFMSIVLGLVTIFLNYCIIMPPNSE